MCAACIVANLTMFQRAAQRPSNPGKAMPPPKGRTRESRGHQRFLFLGSTVGLGWEDQSYLPYLVVPSTQHPVSDFLNLAKSFSCRLRLSGHRTEGRRKARARDHRGGCGSRTLFEKILNVDLGDPEFRTFVICLDWSPYCRQVGPRTRRGEGVGYLSLK